MACFQDKQRVYDIYGIEGRYPGDNWTWQHLCQLFFCTAGEMSTQASTAGGEGFKFSHLPHRIPKLKTPTKGRGGGMGRQGWGKPRGIEQKRAFWQHSTTYLHVLTCWLEAMTFPLPCQAAWSLLGFSAWGPALGQAGGQLGHPGNTVVTEGQTEPTVMRAPRPKSSPHPSWGWPLPRTLPPDIMLFPRVAFDFSQCCAFGSFLKEMTFLVAQLSCPFLNPKDSLCLWCS